MNVEVSSTSGFRCYSGLFAKSPLTLSQDQFSRCRASWQELAGVVVFSAIPFTAVKAIANSPLGETLQRRMQEKKQVALQNASLYKALAENAKKDSFWYGEERPRWLGPIPFDYPSYLDGDLPGDYGFDIAGLSQDPVAFKRYYNFEILHARWAMLAALGALIPELLDLVGAFHFVEPVWWRVGYSKLQGETLDYLGIPGLHFAGSQGVIVIAICQFLLMVGPEYARYCGIEALEPLGIYLPGDINYPGGVLFDPLNLSGDPAGFQELKVKEIKNGRLAMVAWLGFYAQAALTGKGPVQNLVDHISDPLHNNMISLLGSLYKLTLGAAVYYVWQERNRRIHEEKSRPVTEVYKKLIREAVRLRILGLNLLVAKVWDLHNMQWLVVNNPKYHHDG